MKKVSAGEFRKNSGKYTDMALADPITITRHDRPSLVLLSFDTYLELTGKNRRALHVTELSESDLREIIAAKVPRDFNHLNDEMED